MFLEEARLHPRDLSTTDNAKISARHDSERVHMVSSTTEQTMPGTDIGQSDLRPHITKFSSLLEALHVTTLDEHHFTPVHYFFALAHDMDFMFVLELYSLDQDCLQRTTSLGRTPVHHLLGRNRRLPSDVLAAAHDVDPQAFIRKDRSGHVPIDRYFKHNPSAIFDPALDTVVQFFCSSVSRSWGLSAISHSSGAYRARDQIHEGSIPVRFRPLLTGDPYQIEKLVRSCMTQSDAELATAELKFLFVLIPLRAPTKFHLNSTQAIALATRVYTTAVDIYASATNENFHDEKKKWMESIVDIVMYLVHDEGLLNKMLAETPSSRALEALASTEIMATVLRLKFRGGPMLLFMAEFALFGLLGALVLSAILSPISDIATALFGLVTVIYFLVREVHHMAKGRTHEMSSYSSDISQHKAKWTQAGNRGSLPGVYSKKTNEGLGDAGRVGKQGQEMETIPHNLRGTSAQQKESRSAYRRMSLLVRGSRTQGAGDEDTESDDDDAATVFEICGHTLIWTNISQFITVYLGLNEAWRNSIFNWINAGALCSSLITLLNTLVAASVIVAEKGNGSEMNIIPKHILVHFHVLTVSLLCLRAISFLRGVGLKMATFVLMLQEISWKIDTFLVVLGLVLAMFAALFHILLVDEELHDDEWSSFSQSLWKVWGYAIGEVDDTAYPIDAAYPLFSVFGIVVIIIMVRQNLFIL